MHSLEICWQYQQPKRRRSSLGLSTSKCQMRWLGSEPAQTIKSIPTAHLPSTSLIVCRTHNLTIRDRTEKTDGSQPTLKHYDQGHWSKADSRWWDDSGRHLRGNTGKIWVNLFVFKRVGLARRKFQLYKINLWLSTEEATSSCVLRATAKQTLKQWIHQFMWNSLKIIGHDRTTSFVPRCTDIRSAMNRH